MATALTNRAEFTRDQLKLDPVVEGFCDAVRLRFASRLERIVLFGSRARGDFNDDSDYDIAIFVRNLDNAYTEYKPMAALAMRALAEDNVEINAALHPAEDWRDGTTQLMRAMRREGVEL